MSRSDHKHSIGAVHVESSRHNTLVVWRRDIEADDQRLDIDSFVAGYRAAQTSCRKVAYQSSSQVGKMVAELCARTIDDDADEIERGERDVFMSVGEETGDEMVASILGTKP